MATREYSRRALLGGGFGVTTLTMLAACAPAEPSTTGRPRLRYWPSVEFNDEVNAYIEQQARIAGELNGFDVEVFFTPSGDETALYQAALEADTLPDVGARVIDFAALHPRGKLLDVSDLVAEIGAEGGGWFDWALAQVTFDGKQYGVPFTPSPWVTYYHRPSIEALGYSLPFTSMDEMLAFAKEYSDASSGKYALGFPYASQDANGHAYAMMWAFGGAVQDADNNITVESPEVIEAIKWYTDLAKVHGVTPVEATGWTGAGNNDFYVKGIGPIAMNVASLAATMRNDNPERFEETYFGVLPPGPGVEGEFGPAPIEIRRMFISSSTKYPDEAKALVKHLMSPDVYGRLMELSGGFYTPSLVTPSERPYFKDDVVASAIMERIVPNGRNFGHGGADTPWLGEAQAQGWWGTAMQEIILNDVPVEDAVADVAQKLEAQRDRA